MSEQPSAEKDAGLEGRYRVEKINDPTGKHDDCRYFVLDPQHDPIAREALRDYAVHALSHGQYALYRDLDAWLTQLGSAADDGDPWRCAECGSRREVHIAGERDGSVTHAWQPRISPLGDPS